LIFVAPTARGRVPRSAGAAIFLASRTGDYVVGTTIAVDGGIIYATAGAEIAG
jgi:NAD(P)-dependent dehydrogenase (short-subunit alcohol dehydrogenase family)